MNAKVLIDKMKVIEQLDNDNYYLQVEPNDLDSPQRGTTVIMYISTSRTYRKEHAYLENLFRLNGLQLGKMSNDGMDDGKQLVSVRYELLDVHADLARAYFRGRHVEAALNCDRNFIINSEVVQNGYPVEAFDMSQVPQTTQTTQTTQTNSDAQAVVPTAENTQKKESAFSMVKNAILEVASKLTKAMIAELTNKEYVSQQMKISYPLLKKVDNTKSYKDQIFVNGKIRYSKKTVMINGEEFYITNHIFHKNVSNIKDELQKMVA